MRFLVICAFVITAVACASNAAKTHLDNGRQHLLAGQVNDAVTELRKAVESDEKWGPPRFLLAEAYAASGQPELAYRQYIRAADLMPGDPQVQLKAATLLLGARHFGEARDRARRVVQFSPQYIEAQIILANALVGLRDFDGAEAQLTATIANQPRSSEAYTSLASLHLARGRAEDARAAYQKALEIDPRSIPAHVALANMQWTSGDAAAAEETLQRAVSNNPTDVSIHRALVRFYQSSGRFAAAEQHLEFVAETSKAIDDQLALADYYEHNGQLDEARRILDQVVAGQDTRLADVEPRLARLEDAQGQRGAAAERLSAVLAKAPNATEALALRAEWSLRDRRWEEARAAANAALATNSRHIDTYFVRAAADLRTHRDVDAIAAYSEVLRLDPGDVDATVALSRLHLSRNAVDSAVLYAEEAVKSAPEQLDARLALVRAWIARGDDKFARAELDQLVGHHASPELFTLDGLLRLKDGDTGAARAAFERALRLDPACFEALNTLVALEVRGRQFRGARQRIDAALGTDGDDARLLLLSAKLALVTGDRRLAEAQLRRAIELDPFDITGFELLSRLFQLEGRLSSAFKEFDALAESPAASLAPRLMAAVAAETSGDEAGAKQRYRRILKSEPRAALAGKNLAAIYLRRGKSLDVAEQLAAAAAEQLPANAEILDVLGSIHLRRMKYGSAIRGFERAVALEPTNPTFRFHLGSAYAQSGERERAADTLRIALSLNPKLTQAREALDSLSR